MSDSSTNEIAKFLKGETGQIETSVLEYSVSKGRVKRLFRTLKRTRNASLAAEQTSDALRYLSYYLADRANHRQAKAAGYLNNAYRTIYRGSRAVEVLKTGKFVKSARMFVLWLLSVIFGLCTGYLEKPFRTVFVMGGSVCLFFATCFLYVAFFSDNGFTSITFTSNNTQPPPIDWYHYFYFSAVTMTTLGYGDIAPNHSWDHLLANRVMLLLCSLEAIFGYVVLGLGVAVGARRLEAHPTAERAQLLRDYAVNIGLAVPD